VQDAELLLPDQVLPMVELADAFSHGGDCSGPIARRWADVVGEQHRRHARQLVPAARAPLFAGDAGQGHERTTRHPPSDLGQRVAESE